MKEKSNSFSEALLSKSSTAEHLSHFNPIELRYTDLTVIAKNKK